VTDQAKKQRLIALIRVYEMQVNLEVSAVKCMALIELIKKAEKELEELG
jgi:hypothetical protein